MTKPRKKPQREPNRKPGLNERQARFVHEYVLHLNATKAAKLAGYSEATAYSQGHDLLRKPEIAAAVAQARKERFDRLKMDADEVMAELAAVARGNVEDFTRLTENGEPFIDMSEMTREQKAALASVETHDYLDGRGDDARDVRKVVVKLHPKVPALVAIAKHHGLMTEKVELTVDTDLAELLAMRRARAKGGANG